MHKHELTANHANHIGICFVKLFIINHLVLASAQPLYILRVPAIDISSFTNRTFVVHENQYYMQ